MDAPREAEPPAAEEIRFTSRPTAADVLWNASSLMRGSAFSLTIGTFVTVTAAVAFVLGDLFSLVFLLLGLSFLTGTFAAPFILWSIWRRRDLVLAEMEVRADDGRIAYRTAISATTQAWSVYRRARETSRAFLLDTGAGVAVLLSKRGMSPVDVAGLRAILTRNGLLVPVGRLARLRPMAFVTLGLVIAAGLILGPRFVSSIDATARIDLAASMEGRTATVRGSTDLPDGALVGVQVVQLDEWQRASAGGVQPDPETSPWVIYEFVPVTNGAFEVAFETEGWPPGRGGAAAYFWIDDSQPQAVVARFGSDGAGLRGPGVIDRADRGRSLEVKITFTVPGSA
jgi:hypothetical protein